MCAWIGESTPCDIAHMFSYGSWVCVVSALRYTIIKKSNDGVFTDDLLLSLREADMMDLNQGKSGCSEVVRKESRVLS